jgi:hypothetical protein
MKRQNMFSRLPKEDQNHVLDLCSKHPYHIAVEILAQPRDQGGLSLTTSESSLCKFYTRHHPEAAAIQALGQYSAAVQVNQQAHGEPNFEAILGLVQNRILDSLRQGKAVADLDKDFRSLARVQQCFLADIKYRHKNDHVSDAYLEHIKAVARAGDEAEFIRNDVENDPGAGAATIDDFQEDQNQYELDIDAARSLPAPEISPTTTFLRGAARIVAALKFSERNRNYIARNTQKPDALTPEQYDAISGANPQQLLAMMKANAAAAANQAPVSSQSDVSEREISNSDQAGPSKTPAISDISPNFLSPDFSIEGEQPLASVSTVAKTEKR